MKDKENSSEHRGVTILTSPFSLGMNAGGMGAAGSSNEIIIVDLKRRIHAALERISPGAGKRLSILNGRHSRVFVARLTQCVIPNGPTIKTLKLMAEAAERKAQEVEHAKEKAQATT